jgi:hypothetical protein
MPFAAYASRLSPGSTVWLVGEHLHHQQRISSDPVQIVGVPREYQQVRLQ